MAIRTNAILFRRPNALPGAMFEVFTDSDSTVVDTQATAVASGGKFTSGTFSGVHVALAYKQTGCEVNNVVNNASTKLISKGSSTLLWGEPDNEQIPTTVKAALPKNPPTGEVTLANSGNNNVTLANGSGNYNVVGPTGDFTVTGINASASGVKDGESSLLINSTGHAMTLACASGSSSQGNQFFAEGNIDVIINDGGVAGITYMSSKNGFYITNIQSS